MSAQRVSCPSHWIPRRRSLEQTANCQTCRQSVDAKRRGFFCRFWRRSASDLKWIFSLKNTSRFAKSTILWCRTKSKMDYTKPKNTRCLLCTKAKKAAQHFEVWYVHDTHILPGQVTRNARSTSYSSSATWPARSSRAEQVDSLGRISAGDFFLVVKKTWPPLIC